MSWELQTLEDQIRPSHTAVLVIDMQNDFCAQGGYLHRKWNIDVTESATIARQIMSLVEAARAADMMVAWISAIYDECYLSDAHRARVLHLAGGDIICAEGSWGADFYEGVRPQETELKIRKHRYSAFHGTDLDDKLKARDIKTIIVTGVSTQVCVDSTLRDGFFLGYHVVVPADCVSAGDADAQESSLTTIEGTFGYVTNAEVLIDQWGALPGRI